MEEEFLCQVCGTSQKESGKCPLCGSMLEKVAMARENGDYIDDDLLRDMRGGAKLKGAEDGIEEDY